MRPEGDVKMASKRSSTERPRVRPRVAFAILGLAASALFFLIPLAGADINQEASNNTWELASDPGHIDSSEAYESNAHPGPNLCEGINGIPFGGDPGWVRRNGSPDPNTPFVVAEGQVFPDKNSNYPNYSVGNDVNSDHGGFKTNPFVTSTDAPYAHYAHDVNAFLTVDAAYRNLLSTGAFVFGSQNELGNMEVEWEHSALPLWAFPAAFDRMKVWGSHIFDCGHGDPDKYRTEIHPPVGWVLYRNTANQSDRDAPPNTAAKRDENPWHWYEPTDHQGIGTTLPTTALGNTPVQATVADAFFSTWGGQPVAHLNGCHDQTLIPDETTDSPCNVLFAGDDGYTQWAQPLLNQDYDFFVPAPPRPAPDAAMVYEVEDHCGDVPANPGDPPGDNVEDVTEAEPGDSGYNIGAPTCNIPFTVVQDPSGTMDTHYGQPGIYVTVKAQSGGVSYPSNHYLAFAKRFKVAWDDSPAPAARVHAYQVDVNHLRSYNDTDDFCGNAGEWIMSLTIGEQWSHPVRGHGEDDLPFWENGAIDDDRNCIGPNGGGYREYAIGESFTIRVVPGEPIHVKEKSWEDDTTFIEDNDVNDVLPVVDDYRSQSEVPGTFESGFPTDELKGGHTIGYSIADMTPAFPTAGSLSIGTPQYGPNADTGGSATRISGLTQLTLGGTDGASAQYHFWADGTSKPSTWSTDSSAPFSFGVSGVPDGRYQVEARAVTAGAVVGQSQRAFVELDTTAPTVTVPADFEVNATSLAGAIVNYTATATDNLPGPVSFGCAPPSGSLFPNGTNAPLTTTVTCTATDAVGNQTVKTFHVTVKSPFGYMPDFVVLGTDWANVGSGVIVNSGNVGAFDASDGVPSTNGFEVVTGPSAEFKNGSQLAGQSLLLTNGTLAGDAFYVDKISAGNGAVYTPKIGYIPLFTGMPTVPAFSAGGPDVTLQNGETLLPGSYGTLTVKSNAVVTLTGGTYSFSEIEVKPGAQVSVTGATTLQVVNRVLISNGATFSPASGSGVLPMQIVLYATGTDGPAKKPINAIDVGSGTIIGLDAYAPNGTLSLGSSSVATGAFLGRRVLVGSNVQLTLNSSFLAP